MYIEVIIMSQYKRLGEALKKARKKAGLTQRELAVKIDKGYSTLQKYELGLFEPSFDTMWKIAAALDTTVETLLGLDQAVKAFDDLTTATNQLEKLGFKIKPGKLFEFTHPDFNGVYILRMDDIAFTFQSVLKDAQDRQDAYIKKRFIAECQEDTSND